jgi:Holliday junction resolvase RusA-like endonuclease
MISFFVEGRPSPGGSKRYVGHSKAGRAILLDMGGNHTKDWRAAVAQAARLAHNGAPLTGPLYLSVTFCMKRPKSHFNRLGLKEDAPTWHTSAPDATKLLRSTEDALKGIPWLDDAQVAWQVAQKRYCNCERYDDQTTGAFIGIKCL